jgi:hypothetical protein
MSRPVVARLVPPPQAVPFTIRQQALAAHPGQPLDAGTLSTLRQSAPAVRSPVSVVTPGYPRKGVRQPSFSIQMRAGGNRPRQPVAGQVGTARQPPRQPMPAGQPATAAPQFRQPMPAGQPEINRRPPSTPSDSPLIRRDDKKILP